MENFEELYDNLEDFISNIEILLTKNIFHGEFQQTVKNFGTELFNLCKQKQFNIESADILALPSFVELFNHTPKQSKGYLTANIESFFSDIIEPTKNEIEFKKD
ncbi:TPA: hypothetical protein ACGOY2_000017 [Streptococcus suis]